MKNFTLPLGAALAALLTLPSLSLAEDKPAREGERRPGGAGGPGAGARFSPEERVKRMTEMLTLNEEQQGKLKAIFEGGREEMSKLRDVPEDQRREKFAEFMKAQNEKVLTVLTPEQQEKYKTAMAERMKREGAPGARRGEGKPGGEARKPEAK